MWTSLSSWLTPTPLFIVVNIVIATIAVISLRSHHPSTPSSLLHRVKSFNFSLLNSDNPDPSPILTRTSSVLARLKSSLYRSDSSEQNQTHDHDHDHDNLINRSKSDSSEQNQIHDQDHDHLINRSKSDSGTHIPLTSKTSFPKRLKKSLSEKLTWVPLMTRDQEEEDEKAIERRRPATSRTESSGQETGDEGVDAKADDFIIMFKNQLKLQRLKSLLRYRDTLKEK